MDSAGLQDRPWQAGEWPGVIHAGVYDGGCESSLLLNVQAYSQ